MAVSLEYIAGFIDGEGYIGIHSNGRGSYKTEISMTNTNLLVLLEIQKVVGGKIYSRDKKGHPNWKTEHSLRLRLEECRSLLPKIVNSLIIKREQALLLISVWDKKTTMSESAPICTTLNRKGKEGGLAS